MRLSPSARADTAGPQPGGPRLAWLCEQSFAHRGLHGGAVVENSRSAFREALTHGYGIELDVRLSRDGFAVVYHDRDLDRLTGGTGSTGGLSAADLGGLELAGGGDRVETLAAILAFIAGRAPLLIELKTDNDPRIAARLSISVRHALEGYGGPAAVMSFDPDVGRWFAAHAPHIVRGLVMSEHERRALTDVMRRHLSFGRAQPHFLAYDVRSLPSRFATRARRRGLPILAWTVRTRTEHALASAHADEIIFEAA